MSHDLVVSNVAAPSDPSAPGATTARAGASGAWAAALVVLLLARLALGFAYSAATPLGEAPDEADHYAYAAYIVEHGRLPAGPEITQGKHPPLYHALAALAAKAAGGTGDRSFLRANPDMSFAAGSQSRNFFVRTAQQDWPWRDGVLSIRVGRFLSMAAGLVLVLATFLLGRAIWPARPELGFAAAAFAAFLPESLFIGGAMSNDMFAAMWSTLALWLAVAARNWKTALLAGLCLGLAFVSKASTGSLALVAGAALFANAWPRGSRWPGVRPLLPAAGRVAAAGIVAFAIAAPWLWRNWQLYGDPFGWSVVLATIDRRQGPLVLSDVAQLGKGWWLSFWGKFGGAGHISLPSAFYYVWATLGISAAAGWLRWLLRRAPGSLARETTLAGWIVLLGAPLVTMAGIYSYSKTALGTDQGRLLFPALAPIALLLVGGLAAWVVRHRARAAAYVFAAGMAIVATAALVAGLIQPFERPPEPSQAQVARATPVDVGFGPLELLGTSWQRESGTLTLYWRAAEPVQDDLRTALRLLDGDGNLVWEWKRSPGAGRYSTDRWQAGTRVADEYTVPPDARLAARSLEIGLRPFPEGPWIAPSSGDVERLALPLP